MSHVQSSKKFKWETTPFLNRLSKQQSFYSNRNVPSLDAISRFVIFWSLIACNAQVTQSKATRIACPALISTLHKQKSIYMHLIYNFWLAWMITLPLQAELLCLSTHNRKGQRHITWIYLVWWMPGTNECHLCHHYYATIHFDSTTDVKRIAREITVQHIICACLSIMWN